MINKYKYDAMSDKEKIEYLEDRLSDCYEVKYEADKIRIYTEFFSPRKLKERRG